MWGTNIPTEGAIKTYVDNTSVKTVLAIFDEDVSKGMATVVYNSWGVIKAKKAKNGTIQWNGILSWILTVGIIGFGLNKSYVSCFNDGTGIFISGFSSVSRFVTFSININGLVW